MLHFRDRFKDTGSLTSRIYQHDCLSKVLSPGSTRSHAKATVTKWKIARSGKRDENPALIVVMSLDAL